MKKQREKQITRKYGELLQIITGLNIRERDSVQLENTS